MEETAAERKARLKAMRAAAEESGLIPARDTGDECVPGANEPGSCHAC